MSKALSRNDYKETKPFVRKVGAPYACAVSFVRTSYRSEGRRYFVLETVSAILESTKMYLFYSLFLAVFHRFVAECRTCFWSLLDHMSARCARCLLV